MKKIILLIFISGLLNLSYSQSRYLIYFEDKGIEPTNKLSKSSQVYQSAESQLSHRSIERRIKNMGEENYITYEDIPVNENYINQLTDLGINIHHKLKWLNAVSCSMTSAQISKVLGLPFVKYVDVVKRLKRKDKVENVGDSPIKLEKRNVNQRLDYGRSITQNELVDVPAVHDLGFAGDGVIVGFIDAGFDWRNNPSTQNLDVIAEHDFIFNDDVTSNQEGDPPSEHNHGTATLSITGGYDPGELIGPAYEASFVLAKTEYVASETNLEEDNYVAALEWMESLGVDVITSSVGYNIFDEGQNSYTYEDMDGRTSIITIASELAFDRGIVTVTSAGNEGNNSWYYITVPADGENIIAVGAVNELGELVSFSSHGPTYDGRLKPEVVAQGIWVYQATPSASVYQFGAGTSFSAPMVAGVAAQLLSAYPHLTNVQVRKIILESCDNSIAPDNDYGFGLISALRAVTYPNLSYDYSKYTLHKIFVDDNGVNETSPQIHYTVNGGNFISENLEFDNGIKYSFRIPGLITGDLVSFYFTYSDNNGNVVRVPQEEYYKFSYGNLNVSYRTEVDEEPYIPDGYSLLQNYPNPFNNQTRIVFLAKEAANAEVIIYDVLGRKVKDLFNGEAIQGVNTLMWNGANNDGGECASGPYFYTLLINGKFFSKKLIYLK